MSPSFDCIENINKQQSRSNGSEENAQSKPTHGVEVSIEDDRLSEHYQESPIDELYLSSSAVLDEQLLKAVNARDIVDSLAPLLYLGVIAGLTFVGASMHLSIALDPILIITSILLTFGLYLVNQYTDQKEDLVNRTDNRFLFQKKVWPRNTAIFFVAVCLFVLAATDRLVPWHMLLIVVGGILYNFKIIPVPNPKKNWHLKGMKIKEMMLIKNIVVSLMWSCSGYIIIMQYKQILLFQRPDCLVVISCFFLCSMVNTLTSDLDDVQGDSAARIKTVATQFGSHGTYILLFIITILALVSLYFLVRTEKVGAAEVFYFVGCVLWVYIVTSPLVKKVCTNPLIRDIVTDSEALVCAVGLLFLSIG